MLKHVTLRAFRACRACRVPTRTQRILMSISGFLCARERKIYYLIEYSRISTENCPLHKQAMRVVG